MATFIRVTNPNAPAHRQQAIIVASKEARLYRENKKVFPQPPPELLHQFTALGHAEKLLRAEGISSPSHQQCLGRLVLPFGQYKNAPFHWLVANDVGYLKFLVDKHRAEVFNPARKGEIGNQWIKDCLMEYTESVPQVSILLEANIDRCIYGQKGFEDHTFQEMWELHRQYAAQKDRPETFSMKEREMIQKANSSVRRWLYTPLTHITSVQMKRFRKYISEKEQQQLKMGNPSSMSAAADDAELMAACQAVEDLVTSQESASASQGSSRLTEIVSKESQPTKKKSASRVKSSSFSPRKEMTASTASSSQPQISSSAPLHPERTSPSASSQPKISKRPVLSGTIAQHSASVLQTSALASTSQSRVTPVELPQSDSPVELEGWVRLWEDPNGIPPADVNWLKEDTERGLFTAVQTYKNVSGHLKRRRVMKSDRMWFYPPEPPGFISAGLPAPHLFFRSRVFVWRPVGVWRYSLKCPRGDTCAGAGRDVHLYKSGYHHRVRHICDVSSWYTMVTEVLCCGPCTKAARNKEGGTVGRWLAWDRVILSQLSEAHQAMFPAVLTCKHGVDKNVVRLLRDRTVGNTMVKGVAAGPGKPP
ncbi:uncharacterized protein LOC144990380 isoform X2 [Oryzias latipes]